MPLPGGRGDESGVGRELLAPDVAQDPYPVLAHHLAHHALGHAALEQGLGEVGEFADGADAQRVDDLAEVGQAPGVALVVGQPLKKSWPWPWVKSVPMPMASSPTMFITYSMASA